MCKIYQMNYENDSPEYADIIYDLFILGYLVLNPTLLKSMVYLYQELITELRLLCEI